MANEDRFRKAFLLLLVVAISAAFVSMIRVFLLTILVAAIFSGVSQPIYRWLLRLYRGRAAAASATTLVMLFVLVVGPLAAIAGIVANQALQVSQNVMPRVQELVNQPTLIDEQLKHLPFYDRIEPYKGQMLTKVGEIVGSLGSFLFRSLSGTLGETVLFFVQFFILLYTMFFFLKDGKRMLDAALAYLPLADADKQLMVDKFFSVARATLKGTLLIGLLQGVLSGLAFWMVGIQGAVFWGTVMIILSIIPGVGGALVWVPAAVILAVTGSLLRGVILALFCGLVVGSVDNLLRPRLVGQDTKMHELLIFFSTMGGLLLFGPMGFVIGPILAALFVTVWEIYGVAFAKELNPSTPAGSA